jgi:hypothetical protein
MSDLMSPPLSFVRIQTTICFVLKAIKLFLSQNYLRKSSQLAPTIGQKCSKKCTQKLTHFHTTIWGNFHIFTFCRLPADQNSSEKVTSGTFMVPIIRNRH